MSPRLHHLGLLAVALSQGCMSLDFLFYSASTTDEYVIDPEIIDPASITFETFQSTDGTLLHGAWVRQPTPSPPLIYFHGNGSHIADQWPKMAELQSWGYDIFLFDYRGFGRSEGTADPSVFEEDGLAAVQHVVEQTGLLPEQIPWAAQSLGAAVATNTADEIGAQAVILESMFLNADALLDGGTVLDLPPGWFWTYPFDNLEAIARIQAPVFIVHGLDDDFIDPDFAPILYEAAPDPKELWQPEGVGHSDLYLIEPDAFRERSRAWFGEFGTIPPLPSTEGD